MDAFVDAFLAIDTNGSGSITINDLNNYVKKNDLDYAMVQKWSELFDPKKTGEITLERFCDVLGLRMSDVIQRRETMVKSSGLPSDVYVIAANMPLERQIEISDEVRRGCSDKHLDGNLTKFTERLKSWADQRYGPSWQVLIVDGGYWITHSHTPENSFHFHMDKKSYVFWQIESLN